MRRLPLPNDQLADHSQIARWVPGLGMILRVQRAGLRSAHSQPGVNVDKENALALFRQSNFDNVDTNAAWSAVNACEHSGMPPDAGWIQKSEKVGYWFTSGKALIHVTGITTTTWSVVITRPRWVSVKIELSGQPADSPSFGFKLEMFSEKGAPVQMEGLGRSAEYLQQFYQNSLLKMMAVPT